MKKTKFIPADIFDKVVRLAGHNMCPHEELETIGLGDTHCAVCGRVWDGKHESIENPDIVKLEKLSTEAYEQQYILLEYKIKPMTNNTNQSGTTVQFKSGDVVQLKSGGPRMTVSHVRPHSVDTIWFVDSDSEVKVYRDVFTLDTLMIVGDEK